LLRGIESILKSTKDDEIANCILERQVQVSTDILGWWFGRLCVSFFPMSVAPQTYRMRGTPDRSGASFWGCWCCDIPLCQGVAFGASMVSKRPPNGVNSTCFYGDLQLLFLDFECPSMRLPYSYLSSSTTHITPILP
jgi:hypothetical protein